MESKTNTAIVVSNGQKINDITNRIKRHIKDAERNFISIGTELIEAKKLVKYGQWSAWLKSNFNLSQSTATRLMNLAQAFENSPMLENLGLTKTKADYLIKLSEDERKALISNNDVEQMSTRELAKCIREYKGANQPKQVSTKKKLNIDVSDLHTNMDYLRECIGGVLSHFENRKGSPDTYDISIELRNLCEETLEKIASLKGFGN